LAKARFVLALVLFLAWLGYLGYLVAERPRGAAVLSRPQFLVSELDVVADVKAGSDVVRVVKVLSADAEAANKLEGTEITVTNLGQCGPPADLKGEHPDLKGDGEYLLALHEVNPEKKEYAVVPTPPSPGFPRGTPRVYPYTKEVAAQYKQVPKN
jgi:hypothetical protein